MKTVGPFFIFTIAFLITNCARLIEIPESSLERRPLAVGDGYIGGLADARETFLSHFKIQIFTAKSGLDEGPNATPKCTGTIDGKLLSNSQMIFPEADFKCKFSLPVLGEKEINIPIAKLLNPPDVSQLPADTLIPTQGKYIGVKYTLAPAPKDGSPAARMKMTPPAPFILGPVITSGANFSGFRVHVPLLAETNTGQSINGAAGIQVLQTGLQQTLPDGSYTFTDVIRWIRYAQGFDDLPPELKTVPPMLGIKQILFESSTKPIAFTLIKIILDVKSLVDFGAGKLIATWFAGDTVIIRLDLLKHKEL